MGTRKSGKRKKAVRRKPATDPAAAQTVPDGPGDTPAEAAIPEPESPASAPSEFHHESGTTHVSGTTSPGAGEPRAKSGRRLNLSLGGMLEEAPTSDWLAGKPHSSHEDQRTLAELAEAVMRAAGEAEASEEPTSPQTEPNAGPEGGMPVTEMRAEDSTSDELDASDEPETSDARSRRGWLSFVPLIALLLVIGLAATRFAPAIGEFGGSAEGEDGGGADLVSGDVAEPSGDDPSQAAVASGEPTATPTATAEPAQTAAQTTEPAVQLASQPTAAPSQPTETATPQPTQAPAPTVAPKPSGVHVGDLDASVREVGKRVKVAVEVRVHDSAHGPVAGATVSGRWSNDPTTVTCVTGPNGACAVEAGPFAPPGSIGFTVVGVVFQAKPYEPALNHDPDGDSQGTSISVKY